MASSSKTCMTCGAVFETMRGLVEHERACQDFKNVSSLICSHCGHVFPTADDASRHEELCLHLFPTKDYTLGVEQLCSTCGVSFNDPHELVDHEILCSSLHAPDSFPDLICGTCGVSFLRQDIRDLHEGRCSLNYVGSCTKCSAVFRNEHNHRRHEEHCKEELPPTKRVKREAPIAALLATQPCTSTEYETGFQGRIKSYFIRCDYNYDLPSFFINTKDEIVRLIVDSIRSHNSIKLSIAVDVLMVNSVGELKEVNFQTANKPIFQGTDLDELLATKFDELDNKLSECQISGSGWGLLGIDGVRVKLNKYNPLRGNSYIKLPASVAKKGACINVKNSDEKCFMYAVLSKFVSRNPQRVHKYQTLEDKYNFSSISFPTSLKDIIKFEKLNKISINVFSLNDNNNVIPIKIVDNELTDHRDLLLLEEDTKKHYIWIKNFEKLIASQISKRDHKLHFCKRCLIHFSTAQKCSEHLLLCKKNEPARIKLPTEKPYVKFENVEKMLPVPYVIYADFECFMKDERSASSGNSTTLTQQHIPFSYCYYVRRSDEVSDVFDDGIPNEPVLYRGSDVSKRFVEEMKTIGEKVAKIYKRKYLMNPMTQRQKEAFKNATHCYMCEQPFLMGNVKVRDHSHINGDYRGPAHDTCNLRAFNPRFLPIIFHNLSGYDSHFIIKELGYDNQGITLIANTTEKYITFSKYLFPSFSLRYLDSFKFMSMGLASLVSNLSNFPILNQLIAPNLASKLTRKGVFPYNYINSMEKLEENILPPIENFYNQLSDSNISDEDYQHAQDIWTSFNCETIGDYSDVYLKTDVILLSEVFEQFRQISLKTYSLDPCHYYTVPGMSWDAMLKFTKIKLDLLTDYDMILMVERGIRGGLVQASHRYAKANNAFLEDYDQNKETSYIAYQDCNNLYGYAMSQYLPSGNFEWVDPSTIDIDSMTPNSLKGYILEVDVHYPSSLHDLHNDLPFMPETTSFEGKFNKLIAHFEDRKRYVVHYTTLKQAMAYGLELMRVNRVLKFDQSPWLKSYIDFNTELRKKAKNIFEKDQYKLYNNAIFGKTMEQIRKRINVKLVTNPNSLEKLISKPTFKDRILYNENLALVVMKNSELKFDKPIFVGMSILDISKNKMYDYHYEVMVKKYESNIKLMYMDTDSFIYHINTPNLYNDMEEMKEHLDTSDYPEDHFLHDQTNKKIMGKFKDEANGSIIKKFVALRSKMYAIKIGREEIKKSKGVSKSIVRNQLTFSDYEKVLFSKETMRNISYKIQSFKHKVFTCKVNKVSLSSYEDKRRVMQDGISTLAFGHWKLRRKN